MWSLLRLAWTSNPYGHGKPLYRILWSIGTLCPTHTSKGNAFSPPEHHHQLTLNRPALPFCACRLHFYNTPIKENFTHAAHPLNIIRNICQPGDFIAVKLDIDNGPMEMAIMDAISGDTDLRRCISEMFFEQHYSHPGEPARDFEALVHQVYNTSPHGMQICRHIDYVSIRHQR